MLKSISGNSSSNQVLSSAAAVSGCNRLESTLGYSPRHSTVTRLGVVALPGCCPASDEPLVDAEFSEYSMTGWLLAFG